MIPKLGPALGSKNSIVLTRMRAKAPATSVVTTLMILGAAGFAGRLGAQVQKSDSHPKNGSNKIWDGAYTIAQAERGRALFVAHCSTCHNEDLTGGDGPALVGGQFNRSWAAHYVDRLFRKIQTTMPAGSADSVSDTDKIDVVAYILNMNGFPPGHEELPLDQSKLATIQIVGKDGPAPLPAGATVEVVGCLAEGPQGTWTVVHSSEPAPATMDRQTEDELKAVDATPLGTGTFQLLDASLPPSAHVGDKVEAKGFLIRKPSDAINVLTLRVVSPACSP